MRIIKVNGQRTEEHEDGTFVLVGEPMVKANDIHSFLATLIAHDEAKIAAKIRARRNTFDEED